MPYWRLAGVYLAFFAVVGAMSPYWGLYLKSLGFDAKHIGFIAAIPMLTKIAAPNFWSWWADSSGQHLRIMRLGAFGALVLFIGLLFGSHFLWVAFFTACFSIFWNAVLPQLEALTLAYLGEERAHHYSKIRVWGSIGFILSVVGLGLVFEYYAINYLLPSIGFFLFIIFVVTLTLPVLPQRSRNSSKVSIFICLRSRTVLVFYGVMFFLQFSLGAYYAFYSIYLESYGYTKVAIGLLWALGVVSEIVVFILMSKLLSRFSRVSLLSVSLLLTALRWCLIAVFANNIAVNIFAQLLHAFSFGVTHAVAIDFIRTTFDKSSQAQGQALYSSLSFGGGASVGMLVSGYLWESSPEFTFLIASSTAFFSWLLTIVFLKTRL